MDAFFTRFANRISAIAGRPATFILSVAVVVVWAVSGPVFAWSDTWQLVINTGTTVVTFLMVFLIQNSQNRDGAAMQAKLDEVLRVLDDARDGFIGIEHLTDTQIEHLRAALEQEVNGGDEDDLSAGESVERLLERR
jgi:low affinity Fe/Cu permease